MTTTKDAFEAQMAVFRQRFAQRLAGEETSLRAALDVFLKAPGDDPCRALRSVAHKLAGSGSLLGYAAIGGTAARLDEKASAMLEGEPWEAEDIADATRALLEAMGARP